MVRELSQSLLRGKNHTNGLIFLADKFNPMLIQIAEVEVPGIIEFKNKAAIFRTRLQAGIFGC
ncbi:MAG: hypothetical protein U5R30_11570 [Deltaproteobacteria bacterium]|nr:hypothetical protein [Deltaproteobacteria bacterium]